MIEKHHLAVACISVLIASAASAQGNFVTHETPQEGDPQGRQTMVFSAPVYEPNASVSSQPPLGAMLDTPPVYEPHVPSYGQPMPAPLPQGNPAQPAFSTPESQFVPPVYQPSPAPAPVSVAPQPATPQQVETPDEIRFRQESETSRVLLVMEDEYAATLKTLEAKRQERKAAILDQFEKDAADPEKVVGLAERLRAAMAELEELHKVALADAERRYNDARLQVLSASPSRIE